MPLVQVAHFSSRVFNAAAQQEADFRAVLSVKYAWVTFTEVSEHRTELRRAARAHGYRVYAPRGTDGAVAVRRDLVVGGWRQGMVPVITETGRQMGSTRPFGPKGVAWVSFQTRDLGRISVSTAHYLTGGRRPGPQSMHGRVDHYRLNRRLARAIGKWARTHGAGRALAFYGGDQNIVDQHADTFFGGPLVSAWDEVEKWPGTGHGNIDVIARHKADGRVSAVAARSHPDARRYMHSDHYLIDATYSIAPTPASAKHSTTDTTEEQ